MLINTLLYLIISILLMSATEKLTLFYHMNEKQTFVFLKDKLVMFPTSLNVLFGFRFFCDAYNSEIGFSHNYELS